MRAADPATSTTQAATLHSSGIATIGGPSLAPSAGDPVSLVSGEASRFELGAEIARGGMGRILEAWDPRQERKVAIKLLLNRSPAMARRFAGEARITARLQHPAIIPIYESGYSAAGEPFYAMKLVLGRSLAAAVAACGSRDERMALLPNIIAVADALAYAHARHVIHRDLNPTNVLLGAYGETVVIDWGLAKELDAPADDDAQKGEAPGVERTSAGRALGTPRYMPPEQASGETADERSDVYTLGALLYLLLTGIAPFASGSSREEVLSLVKAGPPVSVETLATEVPADLAAIVAKAMARRSDDRYASAAEMAADLKRFAAGQLVSVHNYSAAALARRWASRQRVPLMVAAVLLLALSTVATVGVVRVVRERNRADAANVTERKEREAMATQRDAAETLVAFVITRLRDRLEQVGRLDVLGGVGEEVNRYYESVAPLGQRNDPGVAERRAAAVETLAGVEEARHDPERARALYEEAEGMRRALAGNPAGDAALGTLLLRRADFEIALGTRAAAEEPAKKALELSDALVTRNATDARALTLSGSAHSVLSLVTRARGDLDGAGKEAALALGAARQLVAQNGETPDTLRVLGRALDAGGAIDHEAGRFHSANIEEGVVVRERLVAADPKNAVDAIALSRVYEQRARCRRDLGEMGPAIADATRVKDIRTELAQRDPENSEWERLLGQSYDTLCSMNQLGGHPDLALASCRKGIGIFERVAAKNPDAPSVHDNLLLAYQRLGWVFALAKRWPEAKAAYESSIPIAERFATGGSAARFVPRLADAHSLLSEVLGQMGDREGQQEHLGKSIEILEPLSKSTAPSGSNRNFIVAKLALADLDDASDATAEARRLRETAIELFTTVTIDANAEITFATLARACVKVLPSADPHVREVVRKAIGMLELPRVEGADPAQRLAFLARAKGLLGPS